MTAMNIVVLQDSVSLITDTKAANGHMSFNVSKVATVSHMKIAIGTRGDIGALDKVKRLICQNAASYGSARLYLKQNYKLANLTDSEVFLIGIATDGPAACMISEVNTGGEILDIKRGGVVATPRISDGLFDEFASDPIDKMRDVINAQHRANNSVGGFISITTIGMPHGVIECYSAGAISDVGWRAPLAVPSRFGI